LLSYTWESDQQKKDSIVTWKLVALRGRKTRVTLVHSGLTGNAHGVASGWNHYLGKLSDHFGLFWAGTTYAWLIISFVICYFVYKASLQFAAKVSFIGVLAFVAGFVFCVHKYNIKL
jgi:hypothetical protein